MASSSNNNTPTDKYNTTKQGKVLVFTGDNYAAFVQSYTIALVNAKAQSIVNKTEDILDLTAANIATIARYINQTNCKAISMQIISSLVSKDYLSQCDQ